MTDAAVAKVLIEDRRAVGVELIKGGRRLDARRAAGDEVIVIHQHRPRLKLPDAFLGE